MFWRKPVCWNQIWLWISHNYTSGMRYNCCLTSEIRCPLGICTLVGGCEIQVTKICKLYYHLIVLNYYYYYYKNRTSQTIQEPRVYRDSVILKFSWFIYLHSSVTLTLMWAMNERKVTKGKNQNGSLKNSMKSQTYMPPLIRT